MPEPPENSVHPKTRAAWRAWLARHHARTTGIWLVSYKVASGKPRVDYEASVEEALCYGWIDSRAGSVDAERSMLWFAPRKPGTGWSRTNKDRVRRLLAAGKLAPPGLAKVQAAKRDGSWGRLDGVERLEVPRDLAGALRRQPPARANWDTFPRSTRRAILEWILNARRPETRARRVEETARLAARNLRANQWPRG